MERKGSKISIGIDVHKESWQVKAVTTRLMPEFYEAVGQLHWYTYQIRQSRPTTKEMQMVLCSTLSPTNEARQFLEGDQNILCLWADGDRLAATKRSNGDRLLVRLIGP